MVEFEPTGRSEVETPSTITLSPKVHNRVQRMLALTLRDSRERAVDFYRFGEWWHRSAKTKGSPLRFNSKKREIQCSTAPNNSILRTLAMLSLAFRTSGFDLVHEYEPDETIDAHTHPTLTSETLKKWWEAKIDMKGSGGIDEQIFNEFSDFINRNIGSTPSASDIMGDLRRVIYDQNEYSSLIIGATGMTVVVYRPHLGAISTEKMNIVRRALNQYEKFRAPDPHELVNWPRLIDNTREDILLLLSQILKGRAEVYFTPDPANPILTRVSE